MSNDVTPEGIKVAVGQKWQSLDTREAERFGPRICEVVKVEAEFGYCYVRNQRIPNQKATRIAIRRMKKGATGWALVT